MTNDQPVVSIVMPFFNTPVQFMREAIESVINQTFKHWELLIVDDGSSGESITLAKDYEKKYPLQIRYLEHEGHQNRGAIASRQLGFLHARGEYLALLDSDDIFLPSKLEQQVAILDDHPEVAMVYGNTLYWYSWTGAAEGLSRDYMPVLGVPTGITIHPPQLLPRYLLGKSAVPCTCSLLARRQTVQEIGGFEEIYPGMYEDLVRHFHNMYEDQVFYVKMALHSTIIVSDSCWDKYRQHPESLTEVTKSSGLNRVTRMAFLKLLEEYLSQKNITDPDVWLAVKRELWYHRGLGARPMHGTIIKLGMRVKKWLLRIEEWILPVQLRRWIWVRELSH